MKREISFVSIIFTRVCVEICLSYSGCCCNQGCGAVTFLVDSGSDSGSGAAFRLRLRVKLFGGSGSGQNVPAPAAPAPAPMIESSHEPKPAIRYSKMPNVKI